MHVHNTKGKRLRRHSHGRRRRPDRFHCRGYHVSKQLRIHCCPGRKCRSECRFGDRSATNRFWKYQGRKRFRRARSPTSSSSADVKVTNPCICAQSGAPALGHWETQRQRSHRDRCKAVHGFSRDQAENSLRLFWRSPFRIRQSPWRGMRLSVLAYAEMLLLTAVLCKSGINRMQQSRWSRCL